MDAAKQIVLAKMRGQNSLLEKYDLKPHDEDTITLKNEKLDSSDLDSFRKKLTGIERKYSEGYFKQIFGCCLRSLDHIIERNSKPTMA